MYLKSIEIRGFKSFADRTLLNFNNGITAVVGPNGSGKSNISDAVRWVLGEQKVKSLRGGKMEDVIFAGTDFRKPLGFAEVTLLLDNSERKLPIPFTEVSVTRKLFRSGESEYLINNTTCRLKDIHELFMDTGIGKEGYSLIGQGKIEAILSGKMDDRRALLEEAAGIVKYKSRKEESEKKLENTEQNLLRVQDILNTYEERIGPLEREKVKAEKFLVLSKEQRSIQISLILSDLEEFESEKKVLEERTLLAEKNFAEISRKREEAVEKQNALESSMDEKKALETEKKEVFYQKREEMDSSEKEISLLSQRIEDKKSLLMKNEKAVELAKERISLETAQIEELYQELDGSKNLKEEVRLRLDEQQSKIRVLEESLKLSEDAQRGLREEEEDAEEKIRSLQEESKEQYRQRDMLQGRIEHTESVMESYEASRVMNEMAKSETEAEIFELKQKIELYEKDLIARKDDTMKVTEEMAKLESVIKNMEYELKGQESQMNLLKNLEEHYEGHTKSVKSLMTFLKGSSHRLASKVHLVGEVIKPKDGYAQALEVALGSQVNNIITPTDQDAKVLIDLLRARSFGRATFFPLNVIKGTKAKDPVLKKGKLLGNLLDLVEFDAGFMGIAANLLGRIFVARNMEDALASAKEMGYTHRIVTLEGDIINAGGSMTGGSIYKKSSGIFSRKKDLEDLQAANSELKEKRLEELAEKQGLEKIYQEKLKAEREASYVIQDLQMEKTKLQERREGFVKDLNRLAGILKEAERSLASQREELVLLDGELERIEGKIKEHLTQRLKSKDYLKELKEKRTKEYNEYDLLKQEVMEASVQEATLIEAYKGKREAIDKLKVSLETLESSKSELEKENGGLLIEIKEGQNAVALLEKAVEALKSELQHMEKILDEMAMEEIRDKAEMKDLSATVRTLDEEYHVIDKELFKVKDALEKLEKENQSLLNKINDELNLTLAEAKEERIPMEDKDLFRKKLNTLRREISSLGHVNVAAIEEFREVSEHSTFLSSQKEDLEKAKLELKEIIMDMTLRMRTLFTENFKVMNENFNDTFRRLFQGGNAKLILGDGDILEAPIEISVQPPGKKLQNITLMSGGEKVLSAIALTFAILRMKPTPFCILDEIEAALDDANVYRFAEFLSEFARETQFILITHRKGTMESADALYGVTMEEKGISKIVSMDLSAARRENG